MATMTKMLEKDDAVYQRYGQEKELIAETWQAMKQSLLELQLDHSIQDQAPGFFTMEIKIDPFDGSESFYGEWRYDGNLLGSYIAHAGGMAFAEIDILKPHPKKDKFFIEAAAAWGKLNNVQSELRLIPLP